MSDGTMLHVVDEEGNVIGTESRKVIHESGLLHREVHVWLCTPERDIIYQRRAKNKDTFPDLLDASVGGHVEIGEDFVSTALKELHEETGIEAAAAELQFLGMMRTNKYDEVTKKTNNALRAVYGLIYRGRLSDLVVEAGLGAGFEAWPIEKLGHLDEADRKRFIPTVISPEVLEMLHKIVV